MSRDPVLLTAPLPFPPRVVRGRHTELHDGAGISGEVLGSAVLSCCAPGRVPIEPKQPCVSRAFYKNDETLVYDLWAPLPLS